MIARTWYGVVPQAKSDEYLEYLQKTGIPDSRSTAGNKGVFVFRRNDDRKTHFWFISLWESVESIRKFAGDDIEKARYYPEDRKYLFELEPNVTHYEAAVYPESNS